MVCVAASEKPERGKQDETLCGYQPPSQVSVGAPSTETDIARNAAGGGPGSDGEFWIPPLPQFKFRITPTGVEGGRLWSAQNIQFNAHRVGWWTGWKYCKPKVNPPPSFLGFAQ
jgi:hypothetical protein